MRGADRGGAGGLLARRDLRRRWRTVLAMGLLLGVVAGIGLGCLAGARRTSSLFARHLEASNAADLEIDPGQPSPEFDRAMAALPHVTDVSWWATVSAYPLDEHGKVDPRYVGGLSFITDGRYLDMDRVSVAEGRLLDPDQPDEIMLNPYYALVLGKSVGDTVSLGYVPTDDDGVPTTRTPVETVDATVVGITALNEDVVGDILDRAPRLFVSPAFAPPDDGGNYVGFAWYGLQLEHGTAAESDEAIGTWGAYARQNDALSFVHRGSDVHTKAARAVRPLVVAVAAFGLLTTLAALVLAAQAAGRIVRQGAPDTRLTQVLGLPRRSAFGAEMAVPVAAVALAGAAALVTTLVLSDAFPAGPYQVLEPHPGTAADLTVLLPGLAVVVLVPLLAAALVARRETRQISLERVPAARRPSIIVDRLARSGSPASLLAATRFTVESGRGRSYVPVRSVIVSTLIIVVVIVTTLVFGANLDALYADTSRFGWEADGGLTPDGGYGRLDPDTFTTFADDHDDILGWELAGADSTVIDQRQVAGVMFGQRHGADYAPVLLDGHAPGPGEVVVGRRTLDEVDAAIGDTVEMGAGDGARSMTVVGTAVFPELGPVIALRTGLDQGVWVDPHDKAVFDTLDLYGSPWNFALLRLGPHPDFVGLVSASDDGTLSPDGGSVDVVGVLRPAEVATAEEANDYRPVVVGVLGVAALLSLLLILLTVVRRRRHDLAVFRVLGFTPRQLRWTVVIQALLVALAALVVGVPIGLVLGRVSWRAFADALGVVPDPTTPWRAVLITSGAILVLAMVAALIPALVVSRRRSARLDPE